MPGSPPALRTLSSWPRRLSAGFWRPVPGRGSCAARCAGADHSYPTRGDIRTAHKQGLRLVTPADFLAALRGTGAGCPSGTTR